MPNVHFVEGGATRTASVRAGIRAAAQYGPEMIFIHDAARPGLQPGTVAALLDALSEADGAAPALPVSDALRRAGEDGAVSDLVARDRLYRVQTPQAFKFKAIAAAYDQSGDALYEDDLAVAHAAGLKTRLIPGEARLMKLTYAEDFAILEAMMGAQTRNCVGSGFDAHRFGEGDHVILCGVKIPHDRGLIGHSDADAGWHALVDALLGAIGAGDIGAHFPPTDARWKGANSETFLRHARDLVAQAGGRIQNVDVTLICERPKIGPHRDAMCARTAEVLGLDPVFVNIKATTTEKMGFTGRQEGLAAEAVVSVARSF